MSKSEIDALISDIPTGVSSVKVLLYGEPGSGKTILGMQVAEAITTDNQTVFYIDSAQGYVSLNNHPELSNLRSRMKRVKWGRETLQEELIARIEKGEYGNVGCIVYDEFSSMIGDDLTWVVNERMKATGRGTGDEVEQRDYGTNLRRMTRLIDAAVRSNIHIVFIGHSKTDEDLRKKILPNFRDSIFPAINGQVHVVGYVTAAVSPDGKGGFTTERKVQLQPSKTVEAKSRIGVISSPIATPTEFVTGIGKWAESNNKSINDDDTFAGIEAE